MGSMVGNSFVVRRAAEQLTSPLIPAPRGVWSSARRGEVDGSSFLGGGVLVEAGEGNTLALTSLCVRLFPEVVFLVRAVFS